MLRQKLFWSICKNRLVDEIPKKITNRHNLSIILLKESNDMASTHFSFRSLRRCTDVRGPKFRNNDLDYWWYSNMYIFVQKNKVVLKSVQTKNRVKSQKLMHLKSQTFSDCYRKCVQQACCRNNMNILFLCFMWHCHTKTSRHFRNFVPEKCAGFNVFFTWTCTRSDLAKGDLAIGCRINE